MFLGEEKFTMSWTVECGVLGSFKKWDGGGYRSGTGYAVCYQNSEDKNQFFQSQQCSNCRNKVSGLLVLIPETNPIHSVSTHLSNVEQVVIKVSPQVFSVYFWSSSSPPERRARNCGTLTNPFSPKSPNRQIPPSPSTKNQPSTPHQQ